MTKLQKLQQIYQFHNQLGEEIVWTPGQEEIINVILNLGAGGKKFVQAETPTQYGKSSAIAAGLLMRCTKKEQWAIVAGTSGKAQIIMDYFIDYALENPISRKLLESEIALDKLKQDRSRRHLSFSSGFEVRVFSADARNKQATGNAIMGFGLPYVVLDEAGLVDDTIETKVFRMISGFSTTSHLYFKVGNPFFRNHFLKSHNDPDYHLIWIDYHRGIEEGRFTQEFIEKAKKKPQFDVLYGVKFPGVDAVDERGWTNLLSDEDIERCFVDGGSGFGFLKVGCDPAGEGNNFNTTVVRYRNYAKVLFKERLLNQFEFSKKIIDYKKRLKETEQMLPLGYWVDRVGIGEGYYQTLRMDIEGVAGVNVGTAPLDRESFTNLRAETFWRMRQDIKSGKLQLERDDDWFQLTKIKYRTKLEGKQGKIEIMSKEEMLSNGVQSPDVADALALTYVSLDPMETISPEILTPEQGLKEARTFDGFAVFNELP